MEISVIVFFYKGIRRQRAIRAVSDAETCFAKELGKNCRVYSEFRGWFTSVFFLDKTSMLLPSDQSFTQFCSGRNRLMRINSFILRISMFFFSNRC